jgi:Tfp pilus assembly protein PilV
MSRRVRHRTQQGATLVVGLIMLTLLTVMVTSAFTMSSTDLKSVGNLQWREEATAAANKAIEQVISSPFTDAPGEQAIDVDINNDGNADYTVDLAVPTCVSSSEIAGLSAPPSSILLGSAFSVSTSSFYQTVWDIDATVKDLAGGASGASVRVRQGVRVLLTQTQFNSVCGS